MRLGALANRALLRRATRFLVEEAGLRQFLDIGTGLPTADNTHEVAQRHAPDSRIVYVDNDPLVMTHARALLDSSPEGRTAYIEADLNDPESILDDRVLHDTLDLTRPVGLMLIAVLYFIHGDGAAAPIVRRLLDALPAGSYLVATHATSDFGTPEQQALYQQLIAQGRSDVWTRSREEFTDLSRVSTSSTRAWSRPASGARGRARRSRRPRTSTSGPPSAARPEPSVPVLRHGPGAELVVGPGAGDRRLVDEAVVDDVAVPAAVVAFPADQALTDHAVLVGLVLRGGRRGALGPPESAAHRRSGPGRRRVPEEGLPGHRRGRPAGGPERPAAQFVGRRLILSWSPSVLRLTRDFPRSKAGG